MSAGISPIIAVEIARQRERELASRAERARLLGQFGERSNHPPLPRAALVAVLLAFGTALLALAT